MNHKTVKESSEPNFDSLLDLRILLYLLIILFHMEIEHKKTEEEVVNLTNQPNSIKSLIHDFKTLRIKAGSVIIMHSSLSEIGWTIGGPVAVIIALMKVLTSEGTLIMPTFSGDNTDPSHWENPSVPKSWWHLIRNESPAYHPAITPTRGMGIIAETFRTWPKVLRSNHPVSSFAAWGKNAKYITKNHELTTDLGENSPLARIYELNGQILLIGVTHENNSSLHLAEYRSSFPKKHYILTGSAMLVNNERKWVEWKELDLNSDDFDQMGKDFESNINYVPGRVGLTEARLISQQKIVDFAKEWFNKNR